MFNIGLVTASEAVRRAEHSLECAKAYLQSLLDPTMNVDLRTIAWAHKHVEVCERYVENMREMEARDRERSR